VKPKPAAHRKLSQLRLGSILSSQFITSYLAPIFEICNASPELPSPTLELCKQGRA
jgi:hypothetical protein